MLTCLHFDSLWQSLLTKDDRAISARQFELVTSPERFESLKPEWDALWSRCQRALLSQSFDYCLQVWRAIALPNQHKLFCLVGWDQKRMIVAWPFIVCSRRAWRFLRPLGATGAEFTDVLIDDDADQPCWTRAAWQLVGVKCRSDVIILPYVRSGTVIEQTLLALSRYAKVEHDVGLFARLREEADWQSYYNSLSKCHRKKHANLRRRLAELGSIQFEVIPAGDSRCQELIRWMLAQKRRWADRTNRRGEWLYSEYFFEFLVRLMEDQEAKPERLLMVLRLNGAPIAVKLATVSKGVLELMIAGYDASLEKYSPGMRLDEFWVKWALERQLDVDFGNGGEHYKRFWSRENVIGTTTFRVPCSLWGVVGLQARELIKAVRQVRFRARNQQSPETQLEKAFP